jgi:hypothetical protein
MWQYFTSHRGVALQKSAVIKENRLTFHGMLPVHNKRVAIRQICHKAMSHYILAICASKDTWSHVLQKKKDTWSHICSCVGRKKKQKKRKGKLPMFLLFLKMSIIPVAMTENHVKQERTLQWCCRR